MSWFEDHLSVKVDDLLLKTLIQGYYQVGWEEFKRALQHNARAIQQASGVDVQGREALGRIKREYEQSVAVLTPLLARIQATDALIDQIVYKLYGLTKDEIAIVEGLG